MGFRRWVTSTCMVTGLLDSRGGTPGYAKGQKFTAGPEMVGAGPVFHVTGNMDRVFGTGGAVLCEPWKAWFADLLASSNCAVLYQPWAQRHSVSLVPFLRSGPECPGLNPSGISS